MKERFDDTERAKFLIFVWGRSRLPRSSEGFERKFRITPMPKSVIYSLQLLLLVVVVVAAVAALIAISHLMSQKSKSRT